MSILFESKGQYQPKIQRLDILPCTVYVSCSTWYRQVNMFRICEGVGDVVGVVAPLGGVAQVIFRGVQVVEVGVQVRVHEDRGEEEDGEIQVEVEREVEENQRETHIMDDMQME